MDNDLVFYVLNYDINNKKVVMYNIFNNIKVKEATLELLDKYYDETTGEYMDFDEFVTELKQIVAWQERARREYEISVGDAFETDLKKFEKLDCYSQFEPNAEMFAQYLLGL